MLAEGRFASLPDTSYYWGDDFVVSLDSDGSGGNAPGDGDRPPRRGLERRVDRIRRPLDDARRQAGKCGCACHALPLGGGPAAMMVAEASVQARIQRGQIAGANEAPTSEIFEIVVNA